jgi:hypothetical protein
MRGLVNANDLYSAIKRGVNRELKMYGFVSRSVEEHELGLPNGNRTPDIRSQVYDATTAKSVAELTLNSSEQEIRKVTRRHVRRLMVEVNRRSDVVIDDADESDERGPCSIGNGAFPGSSLNRAHDVDSFDAEADLIESIDRKRRLAHFIDAVGIETWRWFLDYWRAGRKPDSGRDRVRFHRLKQKLLTHVTNDPTECG